jgi:hypothetical protein
MRGILSWVEQAQAQLNFSRCPLKPACYMTLYLRTIPRGDDVKELGLGTNLLLTMLLITLSPTDAGCGVQRERGGGTRTEFKVWQHLPTPRKVGLNIPIRGSGGRPFFTRICCRVTLLGSSQTTYRNFSS